MPTVSIYSILLTIEQVLKSWWWLPLPFLLWKPFLFLWKFWRVFTWLGKQKMILLEIRMPKEVVKPIRAMEYVMAGIWQTGYEPPNWMEEWWEGQIVLGIHFEIVSIGGEIHFYIRSLAKYKDSIESHIYSQYPEAEITVAEDYTRNVPQNIPNKEWDLWGTDYVLIKADPYPILTYKAFETEHEALEAKRVDPLSSLLELFSKIKPGEQFWVQISATPIGQAAADKVYNQGIALRDKLAKRPEKAKPRPMIQDIADILITGKVPEAKEEKVEAFPPEMRLTPGEKAIVEAVENKISKPLFRCNMRFMFLGKRDVWFKPNLRLGLGFFANYITNNLNAPYPYGKTITKMKSRPPFSILDKRRLYLRQRRLFKNYCRRFDCYFPRQPKGRAVFILNIEELASFYHFPSWQISPVPGVARVEAKKGAPPALPTE